MKKRALNTGLLSLENLRARPVRSACLAVVAAILILYENMERLKDYDKIGGWLYKTAANISKRYAASLRKERAAFAAPFGNPEDDGGETPVDAIIAKPIQTEEDRAEEEKAIDRDAAVIVFGLLIALGPQFLFKVCPVIEGTIMKCHWSAQGEIGAGALIAALGIGLVFFANSRTRLGLTIGIFLSGVLALLVPHALIGGCPGHSMACRKVTFPAITVISILLLISAAFNALYLARKKE